MNVVLLLYVVVSRVLFLIKKTLLKKRLWQRCFSVSFAKFLRTTFLTEHLWATALVSDVLFYRINGQLSSHSSEKTFEFKY